MTNDEIRNLAIECGATVYCAVFARGEIEFLPGQLAAYTAAVEAPLQARIAQLEQMLLKVHNYPEADIFHHDIFSTLCQLPSTWLSEHDKEVEARVIERCEKLHDTEDVLAPIGNSSYGECYQDGWIDGTSAYVKAIRASK